MTGEAILQEIEKVQQSNENVKIDDGQMTIQVTVVRLPVGSGRKHYMLVSILSQKI